MRRLLPFTDIVIANDEDAPDGMGVRCVSGSLEHGIEERDGYAEMARQLCAAYGCSMVASVIRNVQCVERSQWMGMLYDASSSTCVYSDVHDVHVLEGVAAGDAFNAALIHGILHGFTRQETIDYAICASTLKLTIPGDWNLVSPEEIRSAARAGSGVRVAR